MVVTVDLVDVVAYVLLALIVVSVSLVWCRLLTNCYTKSADPPKQTE